MKTDPYTKTVLTVIAACLLINTLSGIAIFPSAFASNNDETNSMVTHKGASPEYRLVKVNELNTLDVRIVDINTYDELNVNIKSIDTYDDLDVTLKNIETSDELDVNIDEIGGGFITNGQAIKVKITD